MESTDTGSPRARAATAEEIPALLDLLEAVAGPRRRKAMKDLTRSILGTDP
ncbi:MAG: hypothetical protein H0W55_13160 [Actinobacteria bacterium]|nr:hypothetical protein [Actinomycetota bacterium]MDQ3531167.1 hypothetical protein [Actinomycetota bacterium]